MRMCSSMAFLRRPPTGYTAPCDLIEDDLFSDLSISGTKTVKHKSSVNAKRPPSGDNKKKEKTIFIKEDLKSNSGTSTKKSDQSTSLKDAEIGEECSTHDDSNETNNDFKQKTNNKSLIFKSKETRSKTQRPSSATIKVKDVFFEIEGRDSQSHVDEKAFDVKHKTINTVNEEPNESNIDNEVTAEKEAKNEKKRQRPVSAHAKLSTLTTATSTTHAVNRLSERRQRVQSAKAKSSTRSQNIKEVSAHSSKDTLVRKTRPQSAHNFGRVPTSESHIGIENYDQKNVKKRQRPQSAHNIGRPIAGQGLEDRDDVLKPSVFGFKYNRHVYGSNSSIGCTEKTESDDFCLYKLAWEPYIDYDLPNKSTKKKRQKSNLPSSLEVLQPWLTSDISEDVTGVSSRKCLVFLPSCRNLTDDLPVVPPPADPFEDLPHHGEIVVPEEAPKKQMKCNHSKVKRPEKTTSVEEPAQPAEEPDPDSLYPTSRLSAYRCRKRRTVDEVRQEILELERLMQGVGTIDGSSLIVRYQAEITNLQRAVKTTLSGVDERVWERLRGQEDLPNDYFGFRAFSKDHDDMMEKIRRQHKKCVQELAELEQFIIIDERQRYFSKNAPSTC